MTQQNSHGKSRLNYALTVLWDYKLLLVIPTILLGTLAFLYSLTSTPSWTASQSLRIRDNLVGTSDKPGQFNSQESLKSALETVQEVVRRPSVIKAALTKLGAEKSWLGGGGNWPDDQTIEDMMSAIELKAPNGSELGRSEVIILTTKAKTSERAGKLAELIRDELESRLQQVRSIRLDSMRTEREAVLQQASGEYDASAARLQRLETEFGADLLSVRSMTDMTGGDGPLQKSLTEVQAEKRKAESLLDEARLQRQTLISAQANPAQLTATSNELLKMQPRLSQLIAGLNQAEIQLAKLVATYREKHPKLIDGREEVRDIQSQVQKEIIAAIQVVGSQIEVAQRKYDRTEAEEMRLRERLSELAGSRVNYSRLEQEVGKKSQILAQARERLAQFNTAGNTPIQMLTPVGEIYVPTRSDGPGLKIVTAAGILAGLLTGLGLMVLFAPPFEPQNEYETPAFANEIVGRAREAIDTASSRLTNRTSATDTTTGGELSTTPKPPVVTTQMSENPSATTTGSPSPATRTTAAIPPAVVATPTPPVSATTTTQSALTSPTTPTTTPDPSLSIQDDIKQRREQLKKEKSSTRSLQSSPTLQSSPVVESVPQVTPVPARQPQQIASQPAPVNVSTSDPAGIVRGLATAVSAGAAMTQISGSDDRNSGDASIEDTESSLQRSDAPTVVSGRVPAETMMLDTSQTESIANEALENVSPIQSSDPEELLRERLSATISPSADDIVREIKRRRGADSNGEKSGNPFLKAETEKTSPVANEEPIPEIEIPGTDTPDEIPEATIPDQIKNLGRSIAELCEPLEKPPILPKPPADF